MLFIKFQAVFDNNQDCIRILLESNTVIDSTTTDKCYYLDATIKDNHFVGDDQKIN